MGPGALQRHLSSAALTTHVNLLCSLKRQPMTVCQLDDTTALVQTVDFSADRG